MPNDIAPSARPRVTIITPVYNEEQGLLDYEIAVTNCLLSREDVEFDVMFIEDGSDDGSWRVIGAICERSPRMRAIRLSRNFGAHVAITAGIDHILAGTDAVATLACDLQDPPEVVLEFVERWRHGAQIVWGTRRSREERRARILISDLFLKAVRRFAMPRGSKFTTGSFLLMDSKVIDCFRQFREHNRITFALVAWTGFEQDLVLYDRKPRRTGSSGWRFSTLLKAVYDTFIGFSVLPGRLMTVIGLTTFVMSFLLSIYLVVTYFISNVLPGWTGLMLVMTMFFGVLFVMVGMMSEYLQRIFIESTRRPLYFVSAKAGTDTCEHG